MGVRRLATQVASADVSLRVFFPSDDRSAATSFGPWRLPLVRNADLSAGIYPLVMISHGLGGNDWSHHLLAQSLVKAGFIVASLRHPDDLLRVGTPAQSVLRPLELTAGLDAVLSSPVRSLGQALIAKGSVLLSSRLEAILCWRLRVAE